MLNLLFSFEGTINRLEFAKGNAFLQIIGLVYFCLLYLLYDYTNLPNIASEWLFSTDVIWKDGNKILPSNTNVFVAKFLMIIFVILIPLAYMQIAMMFKRLRHLDYVPVNALLLCHMPFLVIIALVAVGADLGTFGVFYVLPFFVPNALFGLLILSTVIGQFWLYFVCFAKSRNC